VLKDVRQRIRLVVDRTSNMDEFKKGLLSLGVEVKEINGGLVYIYEGKSYLSKELSVNNETSLRSIKEALEVNNSEQGYIKNEVQLAVFKSANFVEFVNNLNILNIFAEEKYGKTYFIYGDDVKINAEFLGAEYTVEGIKERLTNKDIGFNAEKSLDFKEEFEEKVKNRVDISLTRIELEDENIIQRSDKGLLIKVPINEVEQKLFIPAMNVDYIQGKDKYHIFIGSRYDYYFTDISDKDHPKGRSIKGQNLVRAIDIANNREGKYVNVPGAAINKLNTKGVTLSLPEYGINKLFIPKEDYIYDYSNGGKVEILLHNNWNYTYTTVSDKNKTIKKDITGQDLTIALNNINDNSELSLLRRIKYMEKFDTRSKVKNIAEALRYINRENIKNRSDIKVNISKIEKLYDDTKLKLRDLDSKRNNFKKILTSLEIYKEYEKYKIEADKQGFFTKKKYLQNHSLDLKVYHAHEKILKENGINPKIDFKDVHKMILDVDSDIVSINKYLSDINDKYLLSNKVLDTVEDSWERSMENVQEHYIERSRSRSYDIEL